MQPKRTVLVTGGTRGIGEAIVQKLASEGYKIHTCARDKSELNRMRSSIPGLETYELDLSNKEEVVRFASSWTEPLYALVNNAGIFTVDGVDAERLGQGTSLFEKILAVNLVGLCYLTDGLVSKLTRSGRIVNIASQLASSGRAGMGAYCASKHALLGLTRSWALELAARQITVNAVSPGWVRTESNMQDLRRWAKEQGVSEASKIAELERTLPQGRFIEPEEVANYVACLLSEGASGITGQNTEIK